MTGPLVLGIETSCDETGAGLVRGHELLADASPPAWTEHARFGGVVPEVASRAHLEAMVPAVDRALATAGVRLAEVDAIAVTAGPGLAGALLVGVCAAKAYALALGKPLYGVNHLAAHVAVDQLEHGPLPSPAIALLVSGGHSSLLLVPDLAREVVPLGATIDDAAGEAFDKVARVLGLPFPGGPHIDRAASGGRRPVRRLPAREVPGRHLRLLVLRPEDGRGPLGRGPRGRRRAGPRGRRGGLLPGGGGRRADPQGRGRLPGPGRRPPGDRRRGGGQLPAARPGRRALRGGRASRCGCRGRACAPTTGPWWPRWAPSCTPAVRPRRRWPSRPTRPCPSPPRSPPSLAAPPPAARRVGPAPRSGHPATWLRRTTSLRRRERNNHVAGSRRGGPGRGAAGRCGGAGRGAAGRCGGGRARPSRSQPADRPHLARSPSQQHRWPSGAAPASPKGHR